ncbi:MAG: hypothetical protein N2422_02025 [Rhodobacteraceae bacterium]|nr:hypothetical protein [Paracoccaceae bacterium]
MGTLTLSLSRIRSGIWEGLLEGAAAGGPPPAIEIVHDQRPLAGLSLTEQGGRWTARAPIPAELLNDGVQTFLVRDSRTGDEIGAFSILTGAAAEADLRAEVDLLRAELDMLKAAFRRHCAETGG